MYKFHEIFKTKLVVLPVIHVYNKQQAINNVVIAIEAKSNGVFLINHGITSNELLRICESVINKFPDFWVGINCLDLTAEEVFKEIFQRNLSDNISGIWVDDAKTDERFKEHPEAEMINNLRENWHGLYFGGVAFKYQRKVDDLELAAKIAAKYVDVITTSGSGTGIAAEVEKIRRMKKAVGEKPLAIASGITSENVQQYFGLSDCFLVATGISRDFKNLDSKKLELLVEKIRKA